MQQRITDGKGSRNRKDDLSQKTTSNKIELFFGDSHGRSLSAIIRTIDCVVHTHHECPDPKRGLYQFSQPSLLDFISDFPYKISNDNDDNDSRLLFGCHTCVLHYPLLDSETEPL